METINTMVIVGAVVAAVYVYNKVFSIGGGVVDAVKEAVDKAGQLGCGPGEQYDAGLCYPECGVGYQGIGPICWSKCGDRFLDAGGRDDGTHCGKGNYGRGVGKPIHACEPGYTKDGLLCYANCDPGYTGVGPLCWEQCEGGYTDDGATCRRDVQVISADNGDCPWYDKCGLTIAKGCSKCPEGYSNDGCTCSRGTRIYGKKTKSRRTKALGCAGDEDYDTGLCYAKCRDSYQGVGPVCWEGCPPNTDDVGVSCQKKSYSRGVGIPIHAP